MGFSLFNDKGEKVDIYFNLPEKEIGYGPDEKWYRGFRKEECIS